MSEYSYYEFQAIDRPLTEAERRELRSTSTRATITCTRFTNHYEWGGFKGDPAAWMEKYFDAYLYMANWRTREVSFRLPKRLLDPTLARKYCCGDPTSVRVKGDFVILDFCCEDGEWQDYSDDGSGWLSSLVPLRADLVAGDHRILYLAWLLCAQVGAVGEEAEEPPLPAGLGELSASLEAFAEFLGIDQDLITAAATRPSGATARPRVLRTVAEIRAAAGDMAEERCRKEAERAATERARRERQALEARERHLDSLAERETETWRVVDVFIATKQPARYDEAVKLLVDLREVGVRTGRQKEVEARLRRLREEHARKPSLLERMRKVGLGA